MSSGKLHMLGSPLFALHTTLIYVQSRLGQDPPPQQQEDSYDGRSLAEVSLYLSQHTVY